MAQEGAPELERAAGARLLACWCTLLDLGTNALPSEDLQRTRELQVEKSNGITPIAAKKRRIPQPIARKTNPGDPPWPPEPPRLADARPTSTPMHAWPASPPGAEHRQQCRRPVIFLLHYLRKFFEVADMPLPLLLPGPNLRYATMRMYTHNTTEGRRRPA